MLFTIIDYIFGTQMQNNQVIKNIQNINSLSVALFTAISSIGYFAFSSHYLFHYTLNLIFYHCSFDLLLTNKLDILIHHIITILLTKCFFSIPIPLDQLHFETLIIFSSELSSIFLVGREWLNKNSFYYKLNDCAFVFFFFYTRLYLLPKYLLLNENCINVILSVRNDDYYKFLYFASLYAFMAINIYWGVVILKSIVSKLRKKNPYLFTFTINEYCLQFTYFLSPLICIYVYKPLTDFQWLDLIGQCLLSYNSCLYHYTLYESIKVIENKKSDDVDTNNAVSIDILNPNIRPFYIADIVSIHIRTFLCIATRLVTIYPLGLVILGLMLVHHLITMYHFYDYTIEMIEEKIPCIYASKDTLFDHIIRLPIFFSIILNMIFSNSLVYSHHNLLSFMLISCVLFVKPSYELNHLCFHFCLLYQTYALCLCNL